MNKLYLLVLPLLCLSAWGGEKEFKLADGRVLRGELVGEKDGQILLAMKVDQATAKVRVSRGDVVSVKDVSAVAVDDEKKPGAPQEVVAAKANDTAAFARAKKLLGEARSETNSDNMLPPNANGSYPYPAWQHSPWIFSYQRPTQISHWPYGTYGTHHGMTGAHHGLIGGHHGLVGRHHGLVGGHHGGAHP